MSDIIEIPEVIRNFTLISGVGDYAQNKACVVSAAVALWRYKRGVDMNGATDELECCCPVVRELCIGLNDSPVWKNDAERTKWGMRLIPHLIDSKKDDDETIRRGFRCADVAVRKLAPMTLRHYGYEHRAFMLESLAEIKDSVTAENANYEALATARFVEDNTSYRDVVSAVYAAADAAIEAYDYEPEDAASYTLNAAQAVYEVNKFSVCPINDLIEELLEIK